MISSGKTPEKQFLNPEDNATKRAKLTTPSSEELWKAFKDGDEAAFIEIYKQYTGILFNYGCQFTGDRELIKDCLQDFFIYLRKNRASLGPAPHLKMYLMKSFRRRVIDYLKKNEKECRRNEAFLIYQFPVELSSETIYINRQIEEEQIQKLSTALKALDAKEREAIYYFYYEGLSYEQVAEIFNFSHVSSARRLIYRGLGRLRKIILIFCLSVMGDLMIRVS